MAPPLTEVADIQLQLTKLLIYRPRKDERLSWLGWLTYSGRFTHLSGHPSATDRAWDMESSPTEDRRSTAVPRNHPMLEFEKDGTGRRTDARPLHYAYYQTRPA